VFFAPAEDAPLWGSDLNKVLPNTYGVQSRYVLVLSTQNYVDCYWTKVEFDAVTTRAPGRILLLDLGALPADLPHAFVYRGSSPAELVGLIDALREKLAGHKLEHSHRRRPSRPCNRGVHCLGLTFRRGEREGEFPAAHRRVKVIRRTALGWHVRSVAGTGFPCKGWRQRSSPPLPHRAARPAPRS